jgi:hypothetical protein
MGIKTNLLEPSLGGVLRAALDAADDELIVVNPSSPVVEALLDELTEGSGPTVGVLADESVLKRLTRDFKLASVAADLVDAGRLELFEYDGTDNTLLVTEESVVAVVDAGGQVAGLATDDEAFISGAYEQYAGERDRAEAFSLRTPGLSRVRETLAERIGEAAAADFDEVLTSMESARGSGDGLDEVTISLLVAAKNDELLYDISKWGEDVGIASKATFSRTKSELEEAGLITTEKVPIDVGRPRLRLKLGDDVGDTSVTELAGMAQSALAKG